MDLNSFIFLDRNSRLIQIQMSSMNLNYAWVIAGLADFLEIVPFKQIIKPNKHFSNSQ